MYESNEIKTIVRDNINNKIEKGSFTKEYYKAEDPYIDEDILQRIINLSTECTINLPNNDVHLDNKRQMLAFSSKKEALSFEDTLYKKGYDEIIIEDNKLYFNNNKDMIYFFYLEDNNLNIKNVCIKGYFSLFDEGVEKGNYITANEAYISK